MIDEAIETTRFPRILGSGDLSSLDPFLIAAEGKVVSKLSASVTVPLAVSLLLGVFYILNMEYTPGVRNIYAFLESILLIKPEQAKKRITVQKLLKELQM